MKLSIIIPTYNEEKYLPYLFETIEGQTWRDFEVIVADNHSTDKTREIAQKFGAKVVDGGLPGAGRNRGASVAQGEILLFVDADILLPAADFLEKSVKEFASQNFGIGTCLLVPISEKLIDQLMHGAYNQYMKLVQDFSPHAPGFCLFTTRECYNAVGGFDEEIKLAEDHYFTRQVIKKTSYAYGILKSYKMPVSVRRMDRDGRVIVASKYLLCEMYMWTRGAIKSDIFKYRFGHDSDQIDQS